MEVRTFSAIDVGSYELAMKIFEISKKNKLREIDHIRHRIDLGTDSYASGRISYENMDELCRVLREFKDIMKTYGVSAYKAYGTSAVREMRNVLIVLDQIKQRTGLEISVLSNSEQRFLDYKAIASKGEDFNRIIEEGALIADIGGGSIQLSLFEKDTLVTTQNMRLGVLRLNDSLQRLNPKRTQVHELLREMIDNQLAVFKKLYLKDTLIRHIIVVDDYISMMLQKRVLGGPAPGYVDRETYGQFMDRADHYTKVQIAEYLGISEENSNLLYISGVITAQVMEICGADMIWAPGVTLCDGIAYEYAERTKLISFSHDFEQDIIACAKNISKRYMGSRKRSDTLESIALTIYDSMKKIHGLGKRERLLLQIAARLHDCGKYISLNNVSECSYHIIMSTEIIGLSHTERVIVANAVKYNHLEFSTYGELSENENIDHAVYLVIAKLTAILRVANGLDRSHKQKFKNIRAQLKDQELLLSVDSPADITLEKGLFRNRADFFEEVFSVRPVISKKRG